jgi:hypothetical protein
MIPFAGLFWLIALLWLAALATYAVGIAALVSIARLPTEAFGPWWDNTRTTWIIGIVISFILPFGPLVTGIMWFANGAVPLRHGQPQAGRPFWAGPVKPYPPYMPPPGYQPPYGQPPLGYPPPPGFPPRDTPPR